jgi:hypothetical protein
MREAMINKNCHPRKESKALLYLGPKSIITAQIRYGQQPVECTILTKVCHPGKEMSAANILPHQNHFKNPLSVIPDKSIIVQFSQPQFAPAPGQHCVIYQDDLVIGGGEIK